MLKSMYKDNLKKSSLGKSNLNNMKKSRINNISSINNKSNISPLKKSQKLNVLSKSNLQKSTILQPKKFGGLSTIHSRKGSTILYP